MQKITEKKRESKQGFLFVFFDLECTQSTPTDKPNVFLHRPNLCVARQHCNRCIEDLDVEENDCPACGRRLHVFYGEECISDFFRLLLCPKKDFPEIIVMSHYGKGYDNVILLEYMLKVKKWEDTKVIMSGAKITQIEFRNLKFIDSINFLCAPLSKLPSMLNIENIAKGYFPHLFNRPENQDYVGKIPDLEYYTPDDMMASARSQLIEWHNARVAEDYVFNFKHEILYYCKLDVEILTKACLKFRQMFMEITTVDPFRSAVTIASACMSAYQKLFLREKTIAILPRGGYRLSDRQSIVALSWLDWVAHSRNIRIVHAGNAHEVVPEGLSMKVDGFCAEENLIFEMFGCYYHGCPICFPEGRDQMLSGSPDESMDSRFEKTQARISTINWVRNQAGQQRYRLEVMWECEFSELKRKRQDVHDFCRNNKAKYLIEPLQPRSSFFGGRCNSQKLFYRADTAAGEKIRYYDKYNISV